MDNNKKEKVNNKFKSHPLVRKAYTYTKNWKNFLDKRFYIYKHLPEKVRLEACTICQLKCTGCSFQRGGNDDLGRGYLSFDNFKRFLDMNPFVKAIELSNYGEVFLNPDLVKIMYHAKEKGVKLSINNGANFNTVSEDQMRDIVETGVTEITGAEYAKTHSVCFDCNKRTLREKTETVTELPSLLGKFIKKIGRCKRNPRTDSNTLPKTIRIDASTVCQLRCAGCYFQNKDGRELGLGHLSLENFVNFIDRNPQIRRVELSNYGEIFLNPQLIDIMAYAHTKGVELTASMGVNFNTVSEEQMKALVDYEFRFISFSIDGASQDTYSKYRIGGDFNRVIGNVKKLQEIKKTRGAVYPELQWQFVPNEENENEVIQAKTMAAELDIPIVFKLNFLKSYKPKDPDRLKAETGLAEVTRQEYLEKHELPYLNDDCLQVFNDPQFNYDGTLLGCCRNESRFFKSNLFSDGIENCLNDKDYQRMKEFLLSKNPDPKNYKGIPCLNCDIWKSRNAYKKPLILHD